MQNCQGCKFFLQDENAPDEKTGGEIIADQGLCRRYPALVIVPFGSSPITMFPPMKNEGWCGEFKEKGND